MTTETYEILALKYGEFASRRRFESFIAADDHDGPHPIDYFVWVIRNANRTIVVDCGFDEAEGAKRGRKIARTPAAALEMIGVSRRQRRAAHRLAPALRPCRHARRLPQGALPSAGRRDGLRHRPRMCHNHLRYPVHAPTTCARWCATSTRAA